MEFRISDTFTDSLSRLTNEEQKSVKTTVFDLQVRPINPGMQFHKLDRARDPNFWSVRVSRDLRLIVHRTPSSILLCYVDHHDDAYSWAERRKLQTHPKTGAAQLVEIRETVKEIEVRKFKEVEAPDSSKPVLFGNVSEDELLSFGVPPEWVSEVQGVNEDTLLDVAGHLPSEAAEALLEMATGGVPRSAQAGPKAYSPFEHPDAQRRFRIMANAEELQRALEYPWEKWALFLHPTQKDIVERNFNGPARVVGSAGTGKTIVALHRAVTLARKHEDGRVLLTTFSNTLANLLRNKLVRLISNEPKLGERIEVQSMQSIANRLYEAHFGRASVASKSEISDVISDLCANRVDIQFSRQFLLSEWMEVIDAWQIHSWESYRDVVRLGRRTRLPESKRAVLWAFFEEVKSALSSQSKITQAEVFTKLALKIAREVHPPFEFVVVDESQDVSVAQLKFLKALGGERANNLFFAGDLGQRIFQAPFSWKSIGVDIRGRSRTLQINYRTSHQIRQHADRLLGPEIADVDGNIQNRRGTISVFDGPAPDLLVADSEVAEIEAAAGWIKDRVALGLKPQEFGIFVRSEEEIDRAKSAAIKAEIPYLVLDERMETRAGYASISTMHLAKGLEFRAVVVLACDDEILPLQSRIETVGDEADLSEVYNTERQLLYVACTRARDFLLVSAAGCGSEFLEDLKS